jgi:hypothetical protein
VDAIHLPNAIQLPTTFGAPGTPLPPGQIVQALVLELINSGVFRLQLPQATVDVKTDVLLQPGATVDVAAKGTGANAKLVIFDSATAPNGAQGGAPRQPIGEGVIVGRVTPAASAKTAAEPLVVRDTPQAATTTAARAPDVPRLITPGNVTPQQALGDAIRTAATRQSGLAPLMADVEQAVQAPAARLPAPVAEAAKQVLALRVPLTENLTAADVKQAFVRSGVLLEAKAAAAKEPLQLTTNPSSTPAMPAPGSDLKAALIVFRQVLKAWSADTEPATARAAAPSRDGAPSLPTVPGQPQAKPPPTENGSLRLLAAALAGEAGDLMASGEPMTPDQAATLARNVANALAGRTASPEGAASNAPGNLPPPYRGAPLSAQQPVPPSLLPDMPPHETAERLLNAADGALARTTLLQAASLPDQPTAQRADQPAQRWTFEMPFVTPQGTGVAQFEVSRDARNTKSDPKASVWRARFSIDVEPMGPVHAMVAIAGERTSVTLWAERSATAAKLNDNARMLSDALRAAELEPTDFQFRVGIPPVVAKQAAPGRFMDRAT